jgi:cytochrome c-type biogenesis protein CcmH/NrfG
MENQTTEKVEGVEPVAAAPVFKPKKSRFAFAKRTPKWLVIGVPVLAIALLAYNGGYLQKAGSKAGEAIAAITPSFGIGAAGTATKAEDKLATARGAFAAGDMKASIEGYRAFIAANPKDISAHGELGNVLYTAGAFPEASQAYFEAASLAIEQNQIEVAEALVPAVIEGNPMLAHELTGKLFDHQVRTNLSQREQADQKQAKQG